MLKVGTCCFDHFKPDQGGMFDKFVYVACFGVSFSNVSPVCLDRI